MKIGFDSKRLFCNFTGLGNYSRTLLRSLAEFYPDHLYYLYTTEIKDTPESIYFLEDPAYLVTMPDVSFKSYWRSWSVKNDLKEHKIQVYHGLSNEIPFNIQKTGIKSVVTIHDLIFRVHPETYSAIDRRIYDIKFRYACKHADRIIAISENTKKDIVNFYNIDPAKIDVIYQSGNPLYYRLKHISENEQVAAKYKLPKDYLLSVGSVEPRKNLKKVIEAISWLKRDLQIPLVVVGRGGKYLQEAKVLADRSGFGKSVIWIENLQSTEHLQSIYQNARAMIYPSLYEGFGLPVLEALLCRTPVITSNRSSLREAGGPSSLYVNPKDPEEIAFAIEKVLTDSDFSIRMANTGYLFAHQNFAPKNLTRQVIDCYESAAGIRG